MNKLVRIMYTHAHAHAHTHTQRWKTATEIKRPAITLLLYLLSHSFCTFPPIS